METHVCILCARTDILTAYDLDLWFAFAQWRQSQVKSGGINIEKSEGVGSGEGLSCLQKKNQFCAKNYAILSKFWYFFPILKHKNFQCIRESGGDYPT